MNYILVFLIVFPMIFFPGQNDGLTGFLYPKLIFLLGWIVAYILINKTRSLKFERGDLLPLLLIILAVVGNLVNGKSVLDLGSRLDGVIPLMATLAVFFIVRSEYRPQSSGKLLALWPLYVLVPILLALVQMLPSVSPLDPLFGGSAADAQPGSSFGNRGSLASFLMLMVPLGIVWSSQQSVPWRKYASQLLVLLVGLTFAFAQTRAAWVALAVIGAGALLVFLLQRRARPIWLPSVAALLLGFAIGYVLPSPERNQHFQSADSGRLILWRVAAEAIAERPVLGWGTGGFADAFQQRSDWESRPDVAAFLTPKLKKPGFSYSLEQTAEGIFILEKGTIGPVDFFDRRQVINDKAHNEFLDGAVQYGLLYPAVWLLWILGILYRAGRQGLPFTLSWLALLVFNLFWMNSVTVLPIAVVLLGLIAASSQQGKQQQASREERLA